MDSADSHSAYFAAMAEEFGRKPGNLRHSLRWTLGDVPLRGRSVLDIGAGVGSTSFYAASAGARRVVSLEPEAAGSRSGAREAFERVGRRLGADQVELVPATIQEFDAGGERFDVLLSMASINHLDEEACMRLRNDPDARARYVEVLRRFAALAAPGADLVVVDASRYNFFGMLGRRSPLTPKIDWKKHQSPRLWAELLAEAGFHDPRIKWGTFNTLRSPGQILLGNRVASFFLVSSFRLRMRGP